MLQSLVITNYSFANVDSIEYLRTDIPCLSKACSLNCKNEGQQALLSSTSDHYVIPDISVHIYLLLLILIFKLSQFTHQRVLVDRLLCVTWKF